MLKLAAAALALTATAASADQIVLDSELEGATLHQSGIDMSVYYTEVAEGLEVNATYLPLGYGEAPARLTMVLADEDDVTFGLPGHRGVAYTFARAGDAVTVTSSSVYLQVAQR